MDDRFEFEQSSNFGRNPRIPLRRRRHYQQLTKLGTRSYNRVMRRWIFFPRYIAERLGRNTSTVHDCWEQWSRDVGKTVIQRTVRNQLLEGQLRARRTVACSIHSKPLLFVTPELIGGRSGDLLFSDESKFCLGDSDGRVLVRTRQEERLQLNCLLPRHTGSTPGGLIWE
ncbi:HTH_Tnp_Tc3_2 domain-containing protein [Trichonephila clavipes]|nr:HTH_Tnp_Tc3_2 domain-containing protein [Trichonephila clavipes]